MPEIERKFMNWVAVGIDKADFSLVLVIKGSLKNKACMKILLMDLPGIDTHRFIMRLGLNILVIAIFIISLNGCRRGADYHTFRLFNLVMQTRNIKGGLL